MREMCLERYSPLKPAKSGACAQSEALTTRLKHIIKDYADGPGILLELLQNADDAGASEVAFLLDTTQYGTNSVLCESLQKPKPLSMHRAAQPDTMFSWFPGLLVM